MGGLKGVVPSLASASRRFYPLFGLGAAGSFLLAACATYTDESALMLGSSGSHMDDGGSDSGGMAPVAGTPSTTAGTSSAGTPSSGGKAGATAGGSGGGGAGGGGGGAGGSAGAGGAGGAGGADMCPDDPNKTEPGKCGCGAADEDSVTGAGCGPLQDSLVHRYSFEGNVMDSVGTQHGTLMGGATVTGGALTLAGAKSGQYLDLPNGIISSLTSATLEAWVTWTGSAGGMWQRVFDFGSSTMPEGQAGDGAKYLFLSTVNFRACYTSATPKAEIFTDSGVAFPTAATAHVAVVVNGTTHNLALYLDGQGVGTTTLNLPLSAINDVNNWLGRSQYAADDYFGGKISEFRIYNAALTGPQLKTSLKMGENTTYLKKQ